MLQQSDALDRMFHALADPARRAMLDRLSQGPASASELAAPLPMTLSAAVQHLRILEGSGLVRSEKLGRVRQCRLDRDRLEQAEGWIAARRKLWVDRLDALETYLDKEQDG